MLLIRSNMQQIRRKQRKLAGYGDVGCKFAILDTRLSKFSTLLKNLEMRLQGLLNFEF